MIGRIRPDNSQNTKTKKRMIRRDPFPENVFEIAPHEMALT